MTEAQGRTMTAEEALRLETDQPWELVEGELHMMTPAGDEHCWIESQLHFALMSHVMQHDLGRVYPGDTGFVLQRGPDTVRAPDVAFVRKDRVQNDRRGFIDDVPDLVAEIVSPGDRTGDVHARAQMWLAHGVRLVWVVWPDSKTVTVYSSRSAEPRTLRAEDSLDGEDVLPGLTCVVGTIFRR